MPTRAKTGQLRGLALSAGRSRDAAASVMARQPS